MNGLGFRMNGLGFRMNGLRHVVVVALVGSNEALPPSVSPGPHLT